MAHSDKTERERRYLERERRDLERQREELRQHIQLRKELETARLRPVGEQEPQEQMKTQVKTPQHTESRRESTRGLTDRIAAILEEVKHAREEKVLQKSNLNTETDQVTTPGVSLTHKKVVSDELKGNIDENKHQPPSSEIPQKVVDYDKTAAKISTPVKSLTDENVRTPGMMFDSSLGKLRSSLAEIRQSLDKGFELQIDVGEQSELDQSIDMTDSVNSKDSRKIDRSVKGITSRMAQDTFNESKEREREEVRQYQEFIDKGRQLLQETDMDEIKGDGDVDEEERQVLSKLEKLQLQERMIDEENKRRAEEAVQARRRIEQLRLQEEKLEKERKRVQRLSSLKQQEEKMENLVEMKIMRQLEEEESLKKLRWEEDRMRQICQQKVKALDEFLDRGKQTEEQTPVSMSNRRLEKPWDPTPTHFKRETISDERSPEELEREYDRMSHLYATLQQTERELEEKERKRILKEEKQVTETDKREEELCRRESYLRQLQRELERKVEEIEESKKNRSKEEELNEREAYLQHYEEELMKKESEIRERLNLPPNENREFSAGERKPGKDPVFTTGITHLVKPYINRFSGADLVPKNESTFEEWNTEVDCLIKLNTYPDHIVNQAVRNSLSGQARRVVFTLGAKATTTKIKQKLENVFGNVSSDESLLQEFYTASQKEEESATLWGIRIEEILQKSIQKGHDIALEQKNKMLKERFWRGLYNTELQNATSVHYHSAISFEMLRRKVRSEEHQITTRRINSKRDKSSITIGSKTTLTSQEKSDKSGTSAQHQPIQLDPKILKELKDLAKRIETLDKKVDAKTKWIPKPFYRRRQGQGQGKDKEKKDDKEDKKKPDTERDENPDRKPSLNS